MSMTKQDVGFYPAQWTAFCTVAWKEIVRILRIWRMTVMPPAINTLLFCVVFGQILGTKIGLVAGVNYMSFIAPGLIMNIVVVESFNNLASSILIEKYHHAIDDLVVSPAGNLAILFGFMIGGFMRALVAGGIASVVAFTMAGITVAHPFIFAYSVLITSAVFGFLGFITGLYAKRFDEIPTIPTFILTPLSFFAGVFYDIRNLPEPWQSLSWFNPVCYMVDTFRFGAIGVTFHDIYLGLGVMSTIALLLFLLCYYLLRVGYGLKQ